MPLPTNPSPSRGIRIELFPASRRCICICRRCWVSDKVPQSVLCCFQSAASHSVGRAGCVFRTVFLGCVKGKGGSVPQRHPARLALDWRVSIWPCIGNWVADQRIPSLKLTFAEQLYSVQWSPAPCKTTHIGRSTQSCTSPYVTQTDLQLPHCACRRPCAPMHINRQKRVAKWHGLAFFALWLRNLLTF